MRASCLNPLFSRAVGAPTGIDLAWVTGIPPLALLVSPLTVLAGPVVSFNLLVAASIPVSGWAAFVLCRRLTERFWAALAGGGVYGSSAYELNHIVAGQLNLAFSLLLPLMAYLVVVWRDGRIGSRAFTGLLALAMALQFYLFLETFADMTAVWVLALLVGYVVAGRDGRQYMLRLSLLVGAAYLLAFVLVAPYLWYALTHAPPGFMRSTANTSLDLAGLVVPRPGQTFGLGWLARYAASLPVPAGDGYMGLPLLAIALAFAIVAWDKKATRFMSVMLVLPILASLGPVLQVGGRRVIGLPWGRQWFLPIVRSAYPARFMVGLAAVAAIAINTPALHIDNGPGLPAFITTGEYRHYLAHGDTVVVISQRGNAGLLWQAETGFYTRLAGGYLNWHIARRTDLPPPVAGLVRRPLTQNDIQQFRRFTKSARIAAILVEQSPAAGQWQAVFGGLGLRGQAIDGVILYRTAP